MKILIAEDDLVSRTLLRRTLEKWGHQVVAAEDGTQAWKLFQDDIFSLVISDWMMPGIDGPDLLRLIRNSRSPRYIYTLLLTARSQKEDVVVGMEAGADDFVTKPFDPGELNARLRAGERILQLEQKLAARNQELESMNARMSLVNDRMRHDLEAAARIQESLLPKQLPNIKQLKFAFAFNPCDELAGDILNVFPLDETRVGLYILDVSSHGVPAALLAVTLSHVLSPMMSQSHLLKQPVKGPEVYRIVPPAEVAQCLNRQFPMDLTAGQYFTLLYGVLDTSNYELTYVQAGHPGPIHWTGKTGKASVLQGFGLPIGFQEDATYSVFRVQLNPGDRLYLYSDGVPEALSAAEEQFGEQRMLESLERSGSLELNESLHALRKQLLEWCGSGLRDDVSLLALELET